MGRKFQPIIMSNSFIMQYHVSHSFEHNISWYYRVKEIDISKIQPLASMSRRGLRLWMADSALFYRSQGAQWHWDGDSSVANNPFGAQGKNPYESL